MFYVQQINESYGVLPLCVQPASQGVNGRISKWAVFYIGSRTDQSIESRGQFVFLLLLYDILLFLVHNIRR